MRREDQKEMERVCCLLFIEKSGENHFTHPEIGVSLFAGSFLHLLLLLLHCCCLPDHEVVVSFDSRLFQIRDLDPDSGPERRKKRKRKPSLESGQIDNEEEHLCRSFRSLGVSSLSRRLKKKERKEDPSFSLFGVGVEVRSVFVEQREMKAVVMEEGEEDQTTEEGLDLW